MKRKSRNRLPQIVSVREIDKNFYFRLGDEQHCFECAGQENVSEWRGRAEAAVLIERAAAGLKPVVSIVLDNYTRSRRQQLVRAAMQEHELTARIFKNRRVSMSDRRVSMSVVG